MEDELVSDRVVRSFIFDEGIKRPVEVYAFVENPHGVKIIWIKADGSIAKEETVLPE